jgi:hypothetical protein
LCGCAAVWWPGPACTLRVGALRHEEEEREHRDNIVDGSDDSDEVVEVEVSMEDMLNNDHAVSLSTTNDAATAIAATAPAAADVAAYESGCSVYPIVRMVPAAVGALLTSFILIQPESPSD